MFSKYFLLLAGLFLLDHGHSSHLIPPKIKMYCPPHHHSQATNLTEFTARISCSAL